MKEMLNETIENETAESIEDNFTISTITKINSFIENNKIDTVASSMNFNCTFDKKIIKFILEEQEIDMY